MRCPECRAGWTAVGRVVAGEVDGAVVRMRFCVMCGAEFETIEKMRAVADREEFRAGLWQAMRQEVGDGRGVDGGGGAGAGGCGAG